jgi:serine/threonine-protein kinase HipA
MDGDVLLAGEATTTGTTDGDDVAKHFRVKAARADEIVREVTSAVRGWRAVATSAGISRAEQERMADAFRVADEG